jgi:serine protease AprX
VWTDPPSGAGAQKALVNDLDLVVRGPGGTTYHGNVFGNGGSQSGAAMLRSFDSRNVEEVVTLPMAAAGSYSIGVRGTDVPLGPQSFALAVVGALN